ncbi:MAG: glycine--tRNA ligase subunit beta, partial [Deltaproteobacteria bacterium]|nr:glycine--tRNA ligase subunit beta [Deltaproteobacteria bacterium]
MARDLLIEIGVEELPAGFIDPAVKDLDEAVDGKLIEAEIHSGPCRRLATPRRLAVLFSGVPERGSDKEETVVGPPEKAAFDADGQPTKAAIGFAKSQGVAVDDLKIVEGKKDPCVAAEKLIVGRPTVEVIAEALPGLIASIPFPKSMRWGAGEFRFARPIHWLVVLFGEEVVEVEVAGIKSGRTTYGHRFMAPDPIELAHPTEYVAKLKEAQVIVDPAERRKMTLEAVQKAAQAKEGRLRPDEDLADINANLVEFPSAVCGRFDEEYLNLPDQVLITAMREHQKYFAVVDDQGKLLPLFVAVNNTLTDDPEVVRAGHERVLRARLADAEFFFTEDTKRSLESRIEDLKGIVYHKDLGTSHDKVERFAGLTGWLAGDLAPDSQDQAVKAAWLSKCDLTTSMVNEFPSLQGVVGQAYALKDGVSNETSWAVGEHYLPDSAEASVPEGIPGAIVSMADKMDTITGMFAINKPPTGAADPYGLRRAALGIVKILIERGWSPGLKKFLNQALDNLPDEVFKVDQAEVHQQALDFFQTRLQHFFTGQGFDHDVVEAVLAE